MAIEIDTLASSSHSTTTNGSASSSSVRLGSGKNSNQIGHYNGISESSPLKKVRDTTQHNNVCLVPTHSLISDGIFIPQQYNPRPI